MDGTLYLDDDTVQKYDIEFGEAGIMDEQDVALKNVFEGSYTLQLVTKSKCPVLISHMKNMFSLSIN